MGDEELQNNQPTEQTEENVYGEKVEESSIIKRMRENYEEALRKLKEKEKEIEKLRELGSVASIEELAKKVENLELENILLSKFPDLREQKDEIIKFRKPNESWEDAIYRYYGQKSLTEKASSPQGFSLGSHSISVNLEEKDYSQMPIEELKKLAEEEFKQKFSSP